MKNLLMNRKKLQTSAFLLAGYLMWFFPLAANATLTFSINSHINVSTFEGLLVSILNVFIIIATPIIVLYIIYAGFLYVTARGNVEQTQKATRALMYAIVGGVIVLGAVALAGIVKNVVDSFITP